MGLRLATWAFAIDIGHWVPVLCVELHAYAADSGDKELTVRYPWCPGTWCSGAWAWCGACEEHAGFCCLSPSPAKARVANALWRRPGCAPAGPAPCCSEGKGHHKV